MKKLCILINSYTAHTSADFSLKNIASTSGRLDVIIRCIIATFQDSKIFRKKIDFYAVLNGPPNPPVTIKIEGRELKYLPTNEKDIGKIIYDLFKENRERINGFMKIRYSFEKNLEEFYDNDYKIIYLVENGHDIRRYSFNSERKYLFVLGDQKGLKKKEEKLLEKYNAIKIKLGPLSYLSSHCIIILKEEIFRKIYAGGGI